jgi:hypothetical protein
VSVFVVVVVVVVYFVIDLVQKLLDTPSYVTQGQIGRVEGGCGTTGMLCFAKYSTTDGVV